MFWINIVVAIEKVVMIEIKAVIFKINVVTNRLGRINSFKDLRTCKAELSYQGSQIHK